MIVRLRFRDAVDVQGMNGQQSTLNREQAIIVRAGDDLIIHTKDQPTLLTKVSVIGNVLWMHEAPDPEPEPAKKPTKKK